MLLKELAIRMPWPEVDAMPVELVMVLLLLANKMP
jgi:hypothetical protein